MQTRTWVIGVATVLLVIQAVILYFDPPHGWFSTTGRVLGVFAITGVLVEQIRRR